MNLLTLEQMKALEQFDTPTICNAIEGFGLRSRIEGYTDPSLQLRVQKEDKPLVAYARTGIISCVAPAEDIHTEMMRKYYAQYEGFALPQVAVIQDIDQVPVGSFWGDVQATVHRALGCIGTITNGGVRDLKEVEKVGFYLYSKEILISHAYIHMVQAATTVTVCGMQVRPGDLIHADYHGAIVIPHEIAHLVADAAVRAMDAENALLLPCREALEAGRQITADEIMTYRAEMAKRRLSIASKI